MARPISRDKLIFSLSKRILFSYLLYAIFDMLVLSFNAPILALLLTYPIVLGLNLLSTQFFKRLTFPDLSKNQLPHGNFSATISNTSKALALLVAVLTWQPLSSPFIVAGNTFSAVAAYSVTAIALLAVVAVFSRACVRLYEELSLRQAKVHPSASANPSQQLENEMAKYKYSQNQVNAYKLGALFFTVGTLLAIDQGPRLAHIIFNSSANLSMLSASLGAGLLSLLAIAAITVLSAKIAEKIYEKYGSSAKIIDRVHIASGLLFTFSALAGFEALPIVDAMAWAAAMTAAVTISYYLTVKSYRLLNKKMDSFSQQRREKDAPLTGQNDFDERNEQLKNISEKTERHMAEATPPSFATTDNVEKQSLQQPTSEQMTPRKTTA